MWQGLKELKNFEMWDGEPIKQEANAIQLSSVLAGDNSFVKDRKIPFRRTEKDQWTVVSDASDDKICFYQAGEESLLRVLKLDEEEQECSSSHRELLALYKALLFEGTNLSIYPESRTIWWLSDNSNVPRFLTKGSSITCLLYTSPSPRDLSTSRMPSSA